MSLTNRLHVRAREMLFYSKSFERIINAWPRLCINCRSINLRMMYVVVCVPHDVQRFQPDAVVLFFSHPEHASTLLWCLQDAFAIRKIGLIFSIRNLFINTTKCVMLCPSHNTQQKYFSAIL